VSLAEKCFAQAFAVGQIGRGKSLESYSVTDSDEVSFANVRNDGNVGGKVELNWQRNEFVERKKIFSFNIWYMKDEDYRIFFRAVNERCFLLIEVRRLMNKVLKFVVCNCVLDVVNNFFQNINA